MRRLEPGNKFHFGNFDDPSRWEVEVVLTVGNLVRYRFVRFRAGSVINGLYLCVQNDSSSMQDAIADTSDPVLKTIMQKIHEILLRYEAIENRND